jgi:hypothetical protein
MILPPPSKTANTSRHKHDASPGAWEATLEAKREGKR